MVFLMSWLAPQEHFGMMNWNTVTGPPTFNATLGQLLHQQLQDLRHQQLPQLQNPLTLQIHLQQQQVFFSKFVNCLITTMLEIFRDNSKLRKFLFRDHMWEDYQWAHQWWSQESEGLCLLHFRQCGCGGDLTSEFLKPTKCQECWGHISRIKVQWVFPNKKCCLYLYKLSQGNWKIPIHLFWCSSLS